jgi:AraC-like DNA-binding protein
MAGWSAFRDTNLGEEREATVRLADMLLSAGHLSRAESGATVSTAEVADTVFARGRYRAEEVRPFVQYFDFDLQMVSADRLRGVYPASLCIGVVMKGTWTSVLEGRRLEMNRPGVPTVLAAGQTFESVIAPTPGQRIRASCLYISAEFFSSFGHDEESLARVFERLLKPGIDYHELSSCDALRSIMHRLYDNPYHGAMGRLHAESLALSAIVELGLHLGGSCRKRGMLRVHRDRVHEARTILDAEMRAPPALRELARRLGTSEVTLRRLFKSTFGVTIADYIRHRRLDAARLMVREGSLRISEIAWRTGYSDPANFTTAYRQRFGHPPAREAELFPR